MGAGASATSATPGAGPQHSLRSTGTWTSGAGLSPQPPPRTVRAVAVDLELQRRLACGSPLSAQQERALLERRAWLQRLGESAGDYSVLGGTPVTCQLESVFEGASREPDAEERVGDASVSDDAPVLATPPTSAVESETPIVGQALAAERVQVNELITRAVDLLEVMEAEATLDWQAYECSNGAQRVELACKQVGEGRAILETTLKAGKRMGCKVSHASHQADELQDRVKQFVVENKSAAIEQPVPPDHSAALDSAREAFEYALYRQKKYKNDDAALAVEKATEQVRQLVVDAAERLRGALEAAAADVEAAAKAVDLRTATAATWALVVTEMTNLEGYMERACDDSLGEHDLKPLRSVVGELERLKILHDETQTACLAVTLTQRQDAMAQAASILADRPSISSDAQHVGVTVQGAVRVLEDSEKFRMIQELTNAHTTLQADLEMLRAAPQRLHPTVWKKTQRLKQSVSNLQQLPELVVLSNVGAARARMQVAEAQVDKKHKQAEAIAKPSKHYTDLRAELQANYELDTWGSCGREWRQDVSTGLLRKCLKIQVCELCKDGGNFDQTVAVCRYFRGVNGRVCKQLEDNDLVAARLYTRTVPEIGSTLNGAVRTHMKEPNEPPEEHLSMYIHLRNAVAELKGADQYDPLYRGQKHLYGSDLELDPEDPKQYEEGRIVHWKAFTTTTLNRSKAHEHTRVSSEEGATEHSGVLFVIEPPHAFCDLGARLFACEPPLSVIPSEDREDEVLLPAGLAFRVLSYEEEKGLRIIKLKQVGRWVSHKIYALQEIRMSDAVEQLQWAIKKHKEAVASARLATDEQSLPAQQKKQEEQKHPQEDVEVEVDANAHRQDAEQKLLEQEQTEPWTPVVDFSSLPRLTSKVIRRAGVAKRLSSHFPSDLAVDPDAIQAAKVVENGETVAPDDHVEHLPTTLRLTVLATDSADTITTGFSFGSTAAGSDTIEASEVNGAFVSCRVTDGTTAAGNNADGSGSGERGDASAESEMALPSIWVPGSYVRSIPWRYLNVTHSWTIDRTVQAFKHKHTAIELMRRRQDEDRYSVYAEARIDLTAACENKARDAVWDEWYELYRAGKGAKENVVGRAHVELAWLP